MVIRATVDRANSIKHHNFIPEGNEQSYLVSEYASAVPSRKIIMQARGTVCRPSLIVETINNKFIDEAYMTASDSITKQAKRLMPFK